MASLVLRLFKKNLLGFNFFFVVPPQEKFSKKRDFRGGKAFKKFPPKFFLSFNVFPKLVLASKTGGGGGELKFPKVVFWKFLKKKGKTFFYQKKNIWERKNFFGFFAGIVFFFSQLVVKGIWGSFFFFIIFLFLFLGGGKPGSNFLGIWGVRFKLILFGRVCLFFQKKKF